VIGAAREESQDQGQHHAPLWRSCGLADGRHFRVDSYRDALWAKLRGVPDSLHGWIAMADCLLMLEIGEIGFRDGE
jgi:hypothetical protein